MFPFWKSWFTFDSKFIGLERSLGVLDNASLDFTIDENPLGGIRHNSNIDELVEMTY